MQDDVISENAIATTTEVGCKCAQRHFSPQPVLPKDPGHPVAQREPPYQRPNCHDLTCAVRDRHEPRVGQGAAILASNNRKVPKVQGTGCNADEDLTRS